ncbi:MULTISPECIES: GNAT family N-acetyltransferase [Bradyrhizobium]|jgi:hypothetical protein|uniref:BioF2-like acetyltransferase domain-containing protein n=1 Tax=Bradyrhizobium diazoefficiens TaxID=1355477 RepID=A0A809XDS8_9BRAD|nr:GNAT family N-acetyltransferase [Bradyrhizobium diazoefficiens]AWO93178.2 hypothetical protein DI395_34925 [Bradyrhizobium diazoefficiens]WLA76431.1 hypothetical protein QIH77_14965 [Bradyrhizobium diazoefficiens]BCE24248.1 hypothetical protein XF1B_69290 [Bradyrhizobium diazoefficiens]BCE50505.1 hypothetical protein XF4B_68540 [Bradyrhizobium diazoefficiens]BCE94008.1 hypothetical protein XF10B_68060 [Bradyrhizobium diazoefficiens]
MSIVLRAWPRIEEFWFDEAIPQRGVDVAWLCQRLAIPEITQPSAKYTLVVDLTLSDEQLLANMQSETRYEIRRAQNKDALEFWAPTAPDPSSLAAFYDLFAQFAADKGLSPVRMEYLGAAARAGVLRLGRMLHEGEVVVWHSYLLIGSRVRLLHSASLFRGQAPARRSLIGRANRLLHWLEMQHFRGAGATLYDFGGWYAGHDDEDLLRINRFKEGFGGTVRQEAQGVRALTLLGRAYLWARPLRAWLGRVPTGLNQRIKI